MQRLTTNDQLRAVKADNFGHRPMNDFEKISRVEMALRIEQQTLQNSGGPANVGAARAIGSYLKDADIGSKLRLANILLQVET